MAMHVEVFATGLIPTSKASLTALRPHGDRGEGAKGVYEPQGLYRRGRRKRCLSVTSKISRRSRNGMSTRAQIRQRPRQERCLLEYDVVVAEVVEHHAMNFTGA